MPDPVPYIGARLTNTPDLLGHNRASISWRRWMVGFYPEFTDTSKKPIVAKRSVYAEEKKIQSRV
jgi:hypothetical protein